MHDLGRRNWKSRRQESIGGIDGFGEAADKHGHPTHTNFGNCTIMTFFRKERERNGKAALD